MTTNYSSREPRFEALFQQAFDLAKKYFSIDLGVDGGHWNVLKAHKAVKDKVPLPSADTETAKTMRMAAFLAVLSSELSEHVFLPTYVLGEAGEFDQFLVDLAKNEPGLESHLRSVLLKAHKKADKESMASKRIKTAARKVLECLEAPFRDRPEWNTLRADLEGICRQACDLWQYVQTLEDSVTPSDELYNGGFEIIEFPSPSPSSRNQKSQSNGSKSAQVSKTKLPANEPRAAPEKVVWPSLIIDDEDEPLANGYALSEEQMKKGKAEEKAEMAWGGRREARKKSRAVSMTENKVEGKRRLLSPKGGDGQKGA